MPLPKLATFAIGVFLAIAALSAAAADADDAKAVEHIKKLKGTFQRNERAPGKPISFVRLNGFDVKDADLKPLAALPGLEYLYLDYTSISDAGLKELAAFKALRHLGILGAAGVTDAGLKDVAALKELRSLTLGSARISDAGLKELKPLENLTDLTINGAPITDQGLLHLASLTKLKSLNLYRAKATGTGFKALAELDQLGELELESLSLLECGVTDAGLKEIAGLARLRTLSLVKTPVTDAGLKELPKLKRLATLHLDKTAVTNAGLKELGEMKQLFYVGLRDTKVTRAGARALQKELPKCQLVLSGGALTPVVPVDPLPPEQRQAVDKGLAWLVKAQARDGHWEGTDGKRATTLTALAGMALIMGGSNLHDGKYKANVARAADWLLERSLRNGLLGGGNEGGKNAGYMQGHGYAMLFLACLYDQEEKGSYRKEIGAALERAVDFSGKAQTPSGGWGYVAAAEGSDFDDASVAVTQVQGLQACLEAGIAGPKPILDKAMKYLEKATTKRGGVIFSLANARGAAAEGGERPDTTAAALAAGLSVGQSCSPDLLKQWSTFCSTSIPVGAQGRFGHDEYIRYYYAQAMHFLGDKGYDRLFPDSRAEARLTWSRYKKQAFKDLLSSQRNDGSWDCPLGAEYGTSFSLTILQLDGNNLQERRSSETRRGSWRQGCPRPPVCRREHRPARQGQAQSCQA